MSKKIQIELHIMSIKQFKDIFSKYRSVYAILCSSFDFDEQRYNGNNILKLRFQDVIQKNRVDCFKKDHTEKIKKFIKQNNISELYICCDSGESRSVAIAAAIMKYYGLNDKIIWKNPHYHTNVFVFKVLCRNLGVFVAFFATLPSFIGVRIKTLKQTEVFLL